MPYNSYLCPVGASNSDASARLPESVRAPWPTSVINASRTRVVVGDSCAYDQIEDVAGAMIAVALGLALLGWETGLPVWVQGRAMEESPDS